MALGVPATPSDYPALLVFRAVVQNQITYLNICAGSSTLYF